MKKVISSLISLGIAAAVAFGTGYSGTLDALILTVVWILIAIGSLSTVMILFGLIIISVSTDKIDNATLVKWQKMEKPNLWVSIPMSLLWLTAFIYVNWTVTAVAYLVQTTALWISVLWIHYVMKNACVERDPLSFFENDEMKNLIKNIKTARKYE
ncbi:MAG: hypothetical protein E4H14_19910 [Candidatus Thorarchaeota archaeon]|nr:MAG: hypothetical protein E4H14_19910 [Candidatus Thorarchaeota archaeon]